MKKFLLAAAATALLGASAAFAQVVVRVAPPPPIVEHRPVAPGPRYVWTDGYHRWDGHRYVWVSGRWVMPPHPGVVLGSRPLGRTPRWMGLDRGPLALNCVRQVDDGDNYAASGLSYKWSFLQGKTACSNYFFGPLPGPALR